MEASVDPQPRGPDWMPITPKTGSLFHAETHAAAMSGIVVAAISRPSGFGATQAMKPQAPYTVIEAE